MIFADFAEYFLAKPPGNFCSSDLADFLAGYFLADPLSLVHTHGY